jgi:hypothetical protein
MDSTHLERALVLLDVPADPAYVVKDHDEARRRAELLARLAAWTTCELRQAERLAGLGIDDCADLHCDADREIDADLFDAQVARLAWVQHAMIRARGTHTDDLTDTIATTLSALVRLVEARRDGREPQRDVIVADAMLLLRGAADHLARVLLPWTA